MDDEFLHRLVRSTATEMGDAFRCFYPLEGNQDLPEALTCTYFAYQLRGEGFHIYPQIQISGSRSNHLDFAAVNPHRRVVIVGEAKQLWCPDKAREMCQDWDRLRQAKITGPQRDLHSGYLHIGCLIATTWSEAIQSWWSDSRRADLPEGSRNSEWTDLKKILDQARTFTENVPLPPRLGFDLPLHVLFAFLPLQSEFERRLGELAASPSLPVLPADFTRADIYDDHD